MDLLDVALVFGGLWLAGWVLTAGVFIAYEWPSSIGREWIKDEGWLWLMSICALLLVWPWAIGYYLRGGR